MKIRSFFTKKRIIWTIILLIIIFLGWFFFIREKENKSIQTTQVVRKDIKKTVLTTGQVVSSTDLSLSFQTNGVVRRINVKEGDNVYEGQVLAVLDQGSVGASLESARGALAQAKANLEKVKASATAEDIAVTASAVDSANVTLENAKQDLLNEVITAYNEANNAVLGSTNILFSNPQSNYPQFNIPGTVQTNSQLVTQINNERIAINLLLSDWQNKVSTTTSVDLNIITTLTLDNLSKVSNFLNNILILITGHTQATTAGSQTTLSTYQTNITTSKSTLDAEYTTVLNTNQAVRSAEYSLAQSKASLALKQAPARPEDVSIAEAQVISAQGNYNAALSAFNNTVLTAPAKGTITQIDIKLGELATAQKQVMKLLNVGELYTEAQISEADIASVEVGQIVDNTFDALGPDKHFQSKILTVNPASTLVSGVVNYKVTGSLDNIPGVKPGMTSNMTILVSEKPTVLVAPSSAVINQNGQKFVRIVTDPKLKTFTQVTVETGLEADGGEVEIISGLTEGQEIVTFVK